ncbi:hypothetical protein, partial [Salmonella sp. s51228]|uniref:hypothetical protein n=1 Tax=Salmonella sp. s51228 TaxID=3159652 RepID=UPI00397F57AA
NTEYSISVSAGNSVGFGPAATASFSTSEFVTTNYQPHNLSVTATSNSLTVTWNNAEDHSAINPAITE